MNTSAAARQADVTIETIRTWCRNGVIAATKVAGHWVIEARSLARRIHIGLMRTHRQMMRILAFEMGRWVYPGAKDAAIRDQFDMGATRYYQILNQMLDNPVALILNPTLINRLRRLRADRRAGRSAHNLKDRRR